LDRDEVLEKDARDGTKAPMRRGGFTRYLNHEPIIARPPSRLYRLQKLVKRNRVAVAAIARLRWRHCWIDLQHLAVP